MIWLSVALGAAFAVVMLALAGVLPHVFTSDDAVLHQAALLWPLFALMQPLNGAVFALDGILIGAGDGPFLAGSMVAAFSSARPCSSPRSPGTGASAACGRRSSCSSSSGSR